ncbi:hypothetical protein BN381_310037 [Candidatus Microthrix parvicella RN1]|uniref:Uncharacterized protein n=1 Tax=Candidatus Neomicrothrix parvicella RN1 TaxID=1229780 RepID=R4Z3R2_9ACTN|nr:hypothetical protein BN381_310037 [Candidatus Microthrix parvicella RN1]
MPRRCVRPAPPRWGRAAGCPDRPTSAVAAPAPRGRRPHDGSASRSPSPGAARRGVDAAGRRRPSAQCSSDPAAVSNATRPDEVGAREGQGPRLERVLVLSSNDTRRHPPGVDVPKRRHHGHRPPRHHQITVPRTVRLVRRCVFRRPRRRRCRAPGALRPPPGAVARQRR